MAEVLQGLLKISEIERFATKAVNYSCKALHLRFCEVSGYSYALTTYIVYLLYLKSSHQNKLNANNVNSSLHKNEVFTAWKVPVFGVFLVCFSDTEKVCTRKTPNTNTFYAVFPLKISSVNMTKSTGNVYWTNP